MLTSLLSPFDFKTKTIFGFRIKSYSGCFLICCKTPKRACLASFCALAFFQGVLDQKHDLSPFIGSLYHTLYLARITCANLVRD